MSTKKLPKTDGKSPVKKTAKKKPPLPPVKETIQAPYVFSGDETSLMNVNLRDHLDQIDALRDQQKQSNADFALRIKGHENNVKLLRNKLGTGQETRPLDAEVRFDTKRSKKAFHHPTTGDFIREEDMQPADWQLPMFKPDPIKGETVAPPGSTDVPAKTDVKAGKKKSAESPARTNPGETSVGAALDKAASET